MRKRYFFFDIDGTLAIGPVGERYVPESTVYALEELQRQGHSVAICTGRAHAMARPYMESLGLTDMVCEGGSGMVLDGKLTELEPLNREACIRVLEECDSKGILWGILCEDSQERLARDSQFLDLAHDTYVHTTINPSLDFHTIPQFYKLFILCTAQEEVHLKALSQVPKSRFSPSTLFVEAVDKGRGVRCMMAHYGAALEDAVVFGDGENDLSMFLPDWTCIAMGNAVPALKACADYVTADADKDGILLACRHFGWIS